MDLEKRVENLRVTDATAYSTFKRIYRFDSGLGSQIIPDSFKAKTLKYFGRRDSTGKIIESAEETVARIEHQKIINIHNQWTGESTLFNSLRADRPGIKGKDLKKEKKYISKLVAESENGCDFCQPEKYTPEDVFGRLVGEHSITAANLAKYDVWSSLVIFNNHNPLKFTLKELSDYIDTSFAWFEAVNNHSPQFEFPFFVWNCLPRAGASQIHGHCQILMSKEPYARVKTLMETYQKYKKEYGADYFQDIYLVHHSMGLSAQHGDINFFASITPIKEKEVIIISPRNPSDDIMAKDTIFRVLRCFIDTLGVFSFNLSISIPPYYKKGGFPYIIRIVDRGSLLKSTADMGGMELYGSSVVADDPYKTVDALKSVF
ncbi:hypothetical protein J2743_000445 [Methanobacterium petrolearium]|nr:hypothetical protein [Methanobacterium petrolearium]